MLNIRVSWLLVWFFPRFKRCLCCSSCYVWETLIVLHNLIWWWSIDLYLVSRLTELEWHRLLFVKGTPQGFSFRFDLESVDFHLPKQHLLSQSLSFHFITKCEEWSLLPTVHSIFLLGWFGEALFVMNLSFIILCLFRWSWHDSFRIDIFFLEDYFLSMYLDTPKCSDENYAILLFLLSE